MFYTMKLLHNQRIGCYKHSKPFPKHSLIADAELASSFYRVAETESTEKSYFTNFFLIFSFIYSYNTSFFFQSFNLI